MSKRLWLILAVALSVIGCYQKETREATPSPKTWGPSDVSIGGVRLGMALDEVRLQLPQLLDGELWQVAQRQERSIWTTEDPRILRFDVKNQKISFLYGPELQVGEETLRDGDSKESVVMLLGTPDNVLQLDRGPENTKTYVYSTLHLTVGVDSSESQVKGGFSLGHESSKSSSPGVVP